LQADFAARFPPPGSDNFESPANWIFALLEAAITHEVRGGLPWLAACTGRLCTLEPSGVRAIRAAAILVDTSSALPRAGDDRPSPVGVALTGSRPARHSSPASSAEVYAARLVCSASSASKFRKEPACCH
jgi:hypothetical protein